MSFLILLLMYGTYLFDSVFAATTHWKFVLTVGLIAVILALPAIEVGLGLLSGEF